MKNITIILLIAFIGLSISCTQPVSVTETIVITETSIVTETIEDTKRIDELEAELKQYQSLIGNLNELLGNVYYVYQKKSDGSSSWGTGFSIEYKDKYYLITAGHIVDGEYGIFKNLGFKANFSSNTIYPRLLAYDNNYMDNSDYGIFYSNKIKTGFMIDDENDINAFILGYEKFNIIKNNNKTNIIGESGSPIIDNEGEVTGISTTDISYYFTDIDLIIKTISNLK